MRSRSIRALQACLVTAVLAGAGLAPAPALAAGLDPADPKAADVIRILREIGVSEADVNELLSHTSVDAIADWFDPSTGARVTADAATADITTATVFEIQATPDLVAGWFGSGGPLAQGAPGVAWPVQPASTGIPTETEWYAYVTTLAQHPEPATGWVIEAGLAALNSKPVGGDQGIPWKAGAKGDFFDGMNEAWSTRSTDGQPYQLHLFQYLKLGGGFVESKTGAVSKIDGTALLTLIPESEAGGFTLARPFAFRGPEQVTGPNQQAADTAPDLTQAPLDVANLPRVSVGATTGESAAPGASEAPVTSEAPATSSPPVTTPGETGTTGGFPWIAVVLVGVLVSLFGFFQIFRAGPKAGAGGVSTVDVLEPPDIGPPPVIGQPPNDGPVAPPVPVAPPETPPTVAPDPCGCTCSATIKAPLDIKICACDEVTYRVVGSGQLGRIEAVRTDGTTLWSRQVRCNIQTTCVKAAEVQRNVDWSGSLAGDVLTVNATARVAFKCEGSDVDQYTTCVAAPVKVKLLPAPCIVEVVTLELGYTEFIGHVSVRLMCGAVDELWGYFPKDKASLTSPFKGTPGSVDHRSGSFEGTDRIGDDYSGYYCTNAKKVWALNLSCEQCRKLREYWDNLEKHPGEYVLASSNCATRAIDSLRAAGVPLNMPGTAAADDEDYQWADDAYRPGLVDDLMDQLSGEGGISVRREIPANPNCTSDH